MATPLDHVRSYYEALNTGDADARRRALHRRRDALLHAPRAARGRADDRRLRGAGRSSQIEGQWSIEDAIERRRAGRDRVDDDLARPRVGRAAARPRHGVVRVPRRADLRGARLPPRRARRTRAATCSASTTPAAATRRCERVREFDKGVPAAAPPSRLPPFGEEHEELRESIRRFVGEELRPHANAVGGRALVPQRGVREAGRAGLPRAQVPGGVRRRRAATTSHDAVLTEELGALRLGRRGRRDRRARRASPRRRSSSSAPRTRSSASWCRRIKGEKIAALGITEPGAGSDVAGIRTTPKRVDGGWVVNGVEDVHHQRRARRLRRHRRQDHRGGRPPRPVVPAAREGDGGLHASRRSSRSSAGTPPTPAELAFQDVFVPDENLLGEENKGFYLIMANFQWERLRWRSARSAPMQRLLEQTIDYALEREAVRPPDRQAPGDPPQDRRDGASSSRPHAALTYHALRLFHDGQDAIREVTMAKLLTQRAACEVADDALQIHGGAGYMTSRSIELDPARRPRPPPRPDRRRHRRDHEGDPGPADGALAVSPET